MQLPLMLKSVSACVLILNAMYVSILSNTQSLPLRGVTYLPQGGTAFDYYVRFNPLPSSSSNATIIDSTADVANTATHQQRHSSTTSISSRSGGFYEWLPWSSTVPTSRSTSISSRGVGSSSSVLGEMVVATADTTKYSYLMDSYLAVGQHVLLGGSSGSGKSLLARALLARRSSDSSSLAAAAAGSSSATPRTVRTTQHTSTTVLTYTD
jgi:P-loop containing dynein motor region